MRRCARGALGPAFQYVPDKDAAWRDLIRLTEAEDIYVRLGVAQLLGSAYQHVPDKDGAWRDLIQLIGAEDSYVRRCVAVGLVSAFQYIPDKEHAWHDLIWLTGDEDSYVRRGATYALGHAFQHAPDKDEAWRNLIRLTGDEDDFVRSSAADALGSAFQHVSDKDGAWRDLIRLIGAENRYVRLGAAGALGSAFQHVPDKDVAWEYLHRLTGNEDSYVRQGAAGALGSAFQHVPDKDVAWEDLHRLTGDEDCDVRASANHSLGRGSIFRATGTESEEGFRKEIKNALEFFERSLKETFYFNPSQFCLLFYRSFYAITFGKAVSEDEVQRYLADAKSASKGSKNKEALLEVVENLANALSEAPKVTDFNAMKSDLNTYRQYCDRAADLIDAAKEDAPVAARILRRGLPIVDDRIKEIIREIQEKAGAVCRETRGTGTLYEPLGMAVNKWAGELSDRDDLQSERTVSRIVDTLVEFCNLLPVEKRCRPCKIVEEIRKGGELEDILNGIDRALLYLQPSIESELKSEENQIDHQKRTTIEIFADIAVHVLVYTVLHHFAEDLMPTIAPILVITALITLILIIRNAKSR